MSPKKETRSNSGTLVDGYGYRCNISNSDVKVLEGLVDNLLEIGLSLNDGGDTPLALFMALQLRHCSFMYGYHLTNNDFKQFFDKIIQAASTDDECSSQCKKVEVTNEDLQEKLDVYQVPDVLYVACCGCK
jgi:hypothetical protein